jgi:hypothetical protein
VTTVHQQEPVARATEAEVWELLGRADVIVRGVLEAKDAAERRLWAGRARAWLRDVGRAWVHSG